MTVPWYGCPGATRTRDPRLRTTVLCSTELRDKKQSTPRRTRTSIALQSGAHDGYKPSALPVELWAQLSCACPYRKTDSHPGSSPGQAFSGICVKWSGWLDSNQRPPASEAGTLAGLSYTLLALRREIESLSPVRQTGRLTRCVTERELVRLGRLERPLNALSTHSLCQLGYRRVIVVGWVEYLRDPTSQKRSKRWVSRRARPNL